mgnify:CR=1 FL=1
MKKIVIVLFIVMCLLLFSKKDTNNVIIPKDAIRFRIIANSNKIEDQKTKLDLKTDLEPIINNILSTSKDINETRENIKGNLNEIKSTIEKYDSNYKINFGSNYFPEKNYKGVTYKAGNYESLVITLGNGLGDNWWCVLFPPLCLLEAKEEDYDDYTYSFFIKEILNNNSK